MSESNADRYLAARERRSATQTQKRALAQQLAVATKLKDPEGIRINERSTGRISRGFAPILDQPEWVSWDRAGEVIRNAVGAEDDFMVAESNLARQERDRLQLR